MSQSRKKAPPRPPAPPTCDHCHKACASAVVRAASGVFCSPKHRKAREALLAAVAPTPTVDVAAELTRALARRGPLPARPVELPRVTPAGQRVLSSWLEGKSPDTQASYQASARIFARWAVEHGYASAGRSEAETVIEVFQRPEDEGNAIVVEWVSSQAGKNRGSIATRCSGMRALCGALKSAKLIGYVPTFRRPRKLRRSAMEAVAKFHGVPEAFERIVAGLEELALAKDAKPIDVRDWALARTGSGLGLRRMELARLDVENVQSERGVVYIHGKGRDGIEAYPLPAKHSAVKPLAHWLRVRAKLAVHGVLITAGGPLFPTMGPTPPAGGRLNRHSINAMFRRRGHEFGVTLKPHDLRRVFCTEAIAQFGMKRAKDITRHAEESTLSLYDMSAGEAMSEMVVDVSRSIDKRTKDAKAKRGRT